MQTWNGKHHATKQVRPIFVEEPNEILSQAHAAERLGINQPKISALANYRLQGFSVERLMHFSNALGCEIEIAICRPGVGRGPGVRVTAA
jgi:Helix-turn-helix domain